MRVTLITCFLIGFFSFARAQNNLFTFRIPASNGMDTVDFAAMEGKKILIVNTATGSNYVSQLSDLQQLYQQFKDSGLVIIACPTNDFGNESLSNAEMAAWCYAEHGVTFLITERLAFAGTNAHPLYLWIASKSLNGVMSAPLRSDFTKILINGQGRIVGYFDGSISPLHSSVLKAIRNN